jgi:hypothetical protein
VKRTPLARCTRLRANSAKARAFIERGQKPIARKTRMRRRNEERAARAFEISFHSHGFVDWVHSLACSVPGCRRRNIEAAHVVCPRSRGGTWEDVAPLCRMHHRRQEKRTDAFNLEFGIDLYAIAAAVAQRWKAFIR